LVRLDKLVAKALDVSRKHATKLVQSGRVSVNDSIEKSASRGVSDLDNIKFEGRQIELPSKRYIVLNKPKGYICSTKDEEYPSALNLIDPRNFGNLHFAGRLDAETTGLVLISDDGQWTHRITSPKFKQPKTYRALLDSDITEQAVSDLEKGVMIKDSNKPTAPDQVKILNPKEIELTITEGRYHQVRRMLVSVGNHVVDLHRLSIGSIILTEDLGVGEWRVLTQNEVGSF